VEIFENIATQAEMLTLPLCESALDNGGDRKKKEEGLIDGTKNEQMELEQLSQRRLT